MKLALALTLLGACATTNAPAPRLRAQAGEAGQPADERPNAGPAPALALAPSPALSSAPSPDTFASELALARAARDQSTPAPPFPGPRSTAAAKRFLAESLAPWARAQIKILSDAEDHYGKAFEAAASAGRVVAASEYLAMLDAFLSGIHAAPVPKEWESDPELANAFSTSLEGATAPYRARGRIIAAKCEEAVRVGSVVSDGASLCASFAAKYPP